MVDINEYIRENYLSMTDREISQVLGISVKAVKNRRYRMNLLKESPDTADALDELYEKLSDVGSVKNVSFTQYVTVKDTGEDSEPVVTKNTKTAIAISPDSGPEWSPVREAPPLQIKYARPRKKTSKTKKVVVLPDTQIGYRFDPKTGELDPFHDESAMNLALQVIYDIRPDVIVNLGDYLDLPQFSKYAQEPLFAHTTQPAIDRGASFLAQQRSASPNAEIVVLEGNHDKRFMDFITRNAMAAFGLKRSNSKPDDWPVLSIPFLLRFDDMDIKYIEGYPSGEYYITDSLKCIHGRRVGKKGRAVHATLDDEQISVILGHNHRIDITFRTTHTRKGPRVIFGAILGCLCRIDGAVPSSLSAIDLNAKPVRHYEDWQQGFGIVEYDEDDPTIMKLEPIHIQNGQCLYNGKVYTADV